MLFASKQPSLPTTTTYIAALYFTSFRLPRLIRLSVSCWLLVCLGQAINPLNSNQWCHQASSQVSMIFMGITCIAGAGECCMHALMEQPEV
jgi:hypothetical protein